MARAKAAGSRARSSGRDEPNEAISNTTDAGRSGRDSNRALQWRERHVDRPTVRGQPDDRVGEDAGTAHLMLWTLSWLPLRAREGAPTDQGVSDTARYARVPHSYAIYVPDRGRTRTLIWSRTCV